MAANHLEGEVEIVLDKKRILKLTWKGLAIFSQMTGISVDTFFQEVQDLSGQGKMIRFDHLATFLWVCLHLHDQGDPALISVDQVYDLFGNSVGGTWVMKQVEVMKKLNEVYSLRQGWDPKKAAAAAAEKAKEAGGAEVPPEPSPISTTS